MAQGHTRGQKRGVAIYFEPDQIEAVNAFREVQGLSFSEAVRLLVEWGLESFDEPDFLPVHHPDLAKGA